MKLVSNHSSSITVRRRGLKAEPPSLSLPLLQPLASQWVPGGEREVENLLYREIGPAKVPGPSLHVLDAHCFLRRGGTEMGLYKRAPEELPFLLSYPITHTSSLSLLIHQPLDHGHFP